jgi:hypothetical protein
VTRNENETLKKVGGNRALKTDDSTTLDETSFKDYQIPTNTETQKNPEVPTSPEFPKDNNNMTTSIIPEDVNSGPNSSIPFDEVPETTTATTTSTTSSNILNQHF